MDNPEFELAEQFALHTHKHFFLTGKAGTGKTTLLKKIAAKTQKNHVVVAPTGVAAINAGGVTLHSMFNLPLTSFIPTGDYADMNIVTNRKVLLNHLKFRREKLQVIREMDLLIIDEVSMVRCDILDAVDFILRTMRRNQQPFGGVQTMLIGDMHQLPPVVKENEWAILKQYYNSPYFFDSQVWQNLDAAEIELKKIYRQSDERFLSILNNIRHQQLEQDDYDELSKRYQPDFDPKEKGYVLLTTHNRKADTVNEQELSKLAGRLYAFEAIIEGDFPENMFPCERVLQLKEGAQVMFIRNDMEGGQYFNGKLAEIKKIEPNKIIVTFNDTQRDYLLHREIWENINYTVDPGSDKIKKNELGTFSQYPLRLAWAITIHKSQGLTFDKVIVDAGQSFAAGQVYVALSRCRTLEGIVLHSLITQRSLHGDERITGFSDAHHHAKELEVILENEKAAYADHLLKRLFNFTKMADGLDEWKQMILGNEILANEKTLRLFDLILANIENINTVARKFEPQLEKILDTLRRDPKQVTQLRERSTKAIEYFTESIFNQLILPVHQHMQEHAYNSKLKRYVHFVQSMEQNFWKKVYQLYDAEFLDQHLFTGEKKFNKELLKTVVSSATSEKKEKGGTYKDTLELHRQGKSIAEIAVIRSLTEGTIKSHFARWILNGEVNVGDVLPPETVQPIEKFLSESEDKSVGAVFRRFGEKYDGGDIRMVLNHVLRLKANQSPASIPVS